jgi:hypothetical protein
MGGMIPTPQMLQQQQAGPAAPQPQSTPNPQPQGPPAQPQGQQQDPFAESEAYYRQQIAANTPSSPSGGPIRMMLQNFIGGMGQSMQHEAGLPTPYDKIQQANIGLQNIQSARANIALHQMQAQQSAAITQNMMRQPVPPELQDYLPGVHMATPSEMVQAVSKQRLEALTNQGKAAVAQIQAGPTINTPENLQGLGLPAQTSVRTANQAEGIVQKQAANIPVDDQIRSMFHLPAGVQTIPASSFIRAMGFMMPQTKTGYEWKETSPGTWEPLPTKSVTTRGIQTGGSATIPQSPGGGGANATPTRNGLPAPVRGGGPIYAYDPKSNETVMTTPQEAQQNGYTNPRKVTQKGIDEDRQLNNRLVDVATKINRYDASLNTPITEGERGNIAGLLGSDKFKAGAFGLELPVDRLNQALGVENVRSLSPAAQQRLVAYYNARESMLGYQRVLAGSARSSDQQLGLNLGALPSPVMPETFAKEGIRQFKENVPIAARGLPRMPGIPSVQNIFGSQTQQHVPGGQATGLTEGATGKGTDGNKYVVKGGVWTRQ